VLCNPPYVMQPPRVTPPPRQGEIVNPSRNRRTRKLRWPCPIPGCSSLLGRRQDRNRHLFVHLPPWMHCPVPGCRWKGDRPCTFKKHWTRDHPSGGQEPDEEQCKTYDPLPFLAKLVKRSLSLEAAYEGAMSEVRKKASELGKPGLCEDTRGRKERRAQQLGYSWWEV
jgi:hypothetical protein